MNRFLAILITIFLLFSAHHAFSQGIWTYYTNELPGEVSDMTQDKQGNYWFATVNGVCELDINGFWHMLVDTAVWDSTMFFKGHLVIDHQNHKWFVGVAMSHATKEYVVKYDDSTFTYYNPSGKEEETWIASLGIDSSGNIWTGSMANWAYWFDGVQWHPFFVPGTFMYDWIGVFCTDRKGKLYIGHNNGISTLDGYLWGDFNTPIYSLSFDKDNNLWFGTLGHGVGVFDGETWSLYTTNTGLLANNTYVAIDSSQNVWVSYWDELKGVNRYNGQKWEHLTHEDGLLDDAVGPMYVDRDGAIWFATLFVKGLSVYKDTTTTKVGHQSQANYLPQVFTLLQNFPNPFNSETMISYELHQSNNIQLSVLNMNGKEVIKLTSGNQQNGFHQVTWNGKDKFGKEASSGIYLYSLRTNSFKETKKMILIR